MRPIFWGNIIWQRKQTADKKWFIRRWGGGETSAYRKTLPQVEAWRLLLLLIIVIIIILFISISYSTNWSSLLSSDAVDESCLAGWLWFAYSAAAAHVAERQHLYATCGLATCVLCPLMNANAMAVRSCCSRCCCCCSCWGFASAKCL